MAHLKGLLESFVKKGGERAQSFYEIVDSEVSLVNNCIIFNALPPPKQAAETGSSLVVANHILSIAITDIGFGLI